MALFVVLNLRSQHEFYFQVRYHKNMLKQNEASVAQWKKRVRATKKIERHFTFKCVGIATGTFSVK